MPAQGFEPRYPQPNTNDLLQRNDFTGRRRYTGLSLFSISSNAFLSTSAHFLQMCKFAISSTSCLTPQAAHVRLSILDKILVRCCLSFFVIASLSVKQELRESNPPNKIWSLVRLPWIHEHLWLMPPEGIEPPTPGSSIQCSTTELQRLKRVDGIEPTLFQVGSLVHHHLCVTRKFGLRELIRKSF